MTDATPRVLVTPRWGGTIDDDWYPWIDALVPGVERVPLPEPDAPTIASCVDAFGAALAKGDAASTICVGHSVSCQGWLHALAAQGTSVAALVCVAGWWTVDEPWPTIQPWIDAAHDLDALRARAPHVRVLVSDDDPFTADTSANAALWRERLDARVTIVPGAKHFNRAEEPTVLAVLEALRAQV